jgi:hypothetical protein
VDNLGPTSPDSINELIAQNKTKKENLIGFIIGKTPLSTTFLE